METCTTGKMMKILAGEAADWLPIIREMIIFRTSTNRAIKCIRIRQAVWDDILSCLTITPGNAEPSTLFGYPVQIVADGTGIQIVECDV